MMMPPPGVNPSVDQKDRHQSQQKEGQSPRRGPFVFPCSQPTGTWLDETLLTRSTQPRFTPVGTSFLPHKGDQKGATLPHKPILWLVVVVVVVVVRTMCMTRMSVHARQRAYIKRTSPSAPVPSAGLSSRNSPTPVPFEGRSQASPSERPHPTPSRGKRLQGSPTLTPHFGGSGSATFSISSAFLDPNCCEKVHLCGCGCRGGCGSVMEDLCR